MPENNGGRPATASRWRSGGLEETNLGRALPSLLNRFGLLPFSDIAFKSLPVKSLPAIWVALPLRSNNYAWRAPSPRFQKVGCGGEALLTPQTGASHQAQP